MTGSVIQLSPRGTLIYQCLNLAVILLPLYALSLLISALSLLPGSPLESWTVPSQRFSAQVFTLLCLSSFIGGGILMARDALSHAAHQRMLRIWICLVAIVLCLGPFTEAAALDLTLALALLAGLAGSARGLPATSRMRIWQLGMLLIAASLPASHLASGELAEALRALPLHLAFPLCALSLAFWLLTRLGALSDDLAEARLRICAFMLGFAALLSSLGRITLPPILAACAAALVIIAFGLVASHLARPLREPNENKSLAGHWIALAALSWLAFGALGAISLTGGLWQAMRGTDLAAAWDGIGGWGSLAIALALVNYTASALRGDNRRVTGYLAFWLISFGAGFAFIAQLCRGVAQAYLREYANPAALSEAELLLPLTLIWLVCQVVLAAGMIVYALGYFARRPRIRVVAP